MDEISLPPPPSRAEVERCYRHPDVETGVHCTRCGKPICTECMVPAPVGHQCPDCVGRARQEFRRGPGRRIAVAEVKGISVVKVLLAAIGVMYVVEVVTSGPGSLMTGPGSQRLIELGGQVPLARAPEGGLIGVAAGQYWRLFTAMFLHAGLIHAALNSWVLFIVGTPLERDLGRLRFAAVYLVSGLFASAASYAFTAMQAGRTDGGIQGLLVVSIGASGAVFGLFGAFVATNWRQRHTALAMARLRAILPWIALNLVLSFSVGFIDWRAHVGGLLAGLVAGYVAEGIGRSDAQRRATTIAGFVAVVAATVALTAFGTARIHGLLPELF
jgi:membrane associated rhomboid family serine protease